MVSRLLIHSDWENKSIHYKANSIPFCSLQNFKMWKFIYLSSKFFQSITWNILLQEFLDRNFLHRAANCYDAIEAAQRWKWTFFTICAQSETNELCLSQIKSIICRLLVLALTFFTFKSKHLEFRWGYTIII